MIPENTRFLNLTNKTDTCWEWVGTTYRAGYGHFRRKINGQWVMYKAHRYSYEYYNGDIPAGHIVRHVCDNPKCVNPGHLLTGTHKENTHDMISRGRKVYGINPTHFSHEHLVTTIRQYKKDNPKATGVELAKLFNTSPAQISRIVNNKIWTIPEEL